MKEVYFLKVSGGKEVFYPWGAPGEAFYISKNQKKAIVLISSILGVAFSFGVIVLIYADYNNVIGEYETRRIGEALFMIFPLLYILMAYAVGKIASQARDIEGCQVKSARTAVLWFSIVLVESLGVWEEVESASWVPAFLCFSYVCFISFIWLKLKKTKGYFFSSIEVSGECDK